MHLCGRRGKFLIAPYSTQRTLNVSDSGHELGQHVRVLYGLIKSEENTMIAWVARNHYRRCKFSKTRTAEMMDSLVNAGLSLLSLITWRML